MNEKEKKYIQTVRENALVKADPTNGMNVYNEMDLVLSDHPEDESSEDKTSKLPQESRLQQLREEAARERETQLADRIETNSFQG